MLVYQCAHKRNWFGVGYYFKGVPGDGEGWIAHSFLTTPVNDSSGVMEPTHWMTLPLPPGSDPPAPAPPEHRENCRKRAWLNDGPCTCGVDLLRCMDCGLPYQEFPLDTTLPDEQWRRIHDSDGGVLCASCIVKRASALPRVIAIRAVIEFAPDHSDAVTIPAALVESPKPQPLDHGPEGSDRRDPESAGHRGNSLPAPAPEIEGLPWRIVFGSVTHGAGSPHCLGTCGGGGDYNSEHILSIDASAKHEHTVYYGDHVEDIVDASGQHVICLGGHEYDDMGHVSVQDAQLVVAAVNERAALKHRLEQAEADVTRLTQERDELLLDRHQPDRLSACGHYRVFALPCLHEDGTETPSCMQCDRDALQDSIAVMRVQVAELLDVARTIVAICDSGNVEHAQLACMETSPLVDVARAAIAKALHQTEQG